MAVTPPCIPSPYDLAKRGLLLLAPHTETHRCGADFWGARNIRAATAALEKKRANFSARLMQIIYGQCCYRAAALMCLLRAGAGVEAAARGLKLWIAARQAGEMLRWLAKRQLPTASRSGMNCPHTAKASAIQACWSSWESALTTAGVSAAQNVTSASAMWVFITSPRCPSHSQLDAKQMKKPRESSRQL